MSKKEREGGVGGGGWSGFIWCEERSDRRERERPREKEKGKRFTHFRGKRHGIEPESDEDYKV